jgi:opacity protein-like surface antigen
MRKLLFLLISLFCLSITNAQSTKPNKSAGITISLPLINQTSFYDYSAEKLTNQSGYLGGGMALFYKKNQNKFTIGYEHPSISKRGSSNINTNIFEAIIHHKIFEQVAISAGLNYTIYKFHVSRDFPSLIKIDKSDATIGLTAGAEFLPSKSTSVVVTYRPSMFSFDKKSYRAVLSFAFRSDLNFWGK